jgi:hypothetical protein
MPPLPVLPEPVPTDAEVVEVQLLLSRKQAEALEAAAHARNMTAGQILRRVITDLFVEPPTRR